MILHNAREIYIHEVHVNCQLLYKVLLEELPVTVVLALIQPLPARPWKPGQHVTERRDQLM